MNAQEAVTRKPAKPEKDDIIRFDRLCRIFGVKGCSSVSLFAEAEARRVAEGSDEILEDEYCTGFKDGLSRALR